MERHWFFTWRTYGIWLPGEDGFVGYYRRISGERLIDHDPGGEFAEAMPALARYSRDQLKSEPMCLDIAKAETLMLQFHETAKFRRWQTDAVAILVNHVHIVVGVNGDPSPSDMLGDWKSYGSRALNRRFGKQEWWATSGSKRRLKSARSRWAAVKYVRDQENALMVWLGDEAKTLLTEPIPDEDNGCPPPA